MVDQLADTVMGRYSLVIQWLPVMRHLARSFDPRPLITIREQTLGRHYNWSINILNKHYARQWWHYKHLPTNDDIIAATASISLTNTQATRSLLLFNWGEHTQGNTKAHTQANTQAHTNTHRQTNTKTNTQAQTQAHKHIGNPLNCLRRTHNVKSHQNTKI